MRSFHITGKLRRLVYGVVTAACAIAVTTGYGPPQQQQGEAGAADAVKALIAKYAEAVNTEPVDIDLASQVWSHSPDVSLIYPRGEEHGWENVKRNFYQSVMEALFSERKLTIRDVAVHVYKDCAWAEFSWHFAGKARKSGARVETNGRETQIYRQTGPNRWVLVHVHYSGRP